MGKALDLINNLSQTQIRPILIKSKIHKKLF